MFRTEVGKYVLTLISDYQKVLERYKSSIYKNVYKGFIMLFKN